MFAINRVNKMGMQYYITEIPNQPGRTEIRTSDKKIVVNHHIDLINQGWFYWMMRDQTIQEAFSFLKTDEREFLLTGITSNEWEKIFSESDGENQ